jgi:tetratricopeptide (TPR) repeat protein
MPAEQRQWLDKAFQSARSVSPDVRARALYVGAGMALGQSDFARSKVLAEQAEELYSELGNEEGALEVRILRAQLAVAAGELDYSGVKAIFEEGLELAYRLSSGRAIARCLHLIAACELKGGNVARASEVFEQAAASAREVGDSYQLASILHSEGDLELARGGLADATSLYREAQRLCDELKLWRGTTYCIAALGAVAAAAGSVERAGALWGALATLERDFGYPVLSNERELYDRFIDTCRSSDPSAFAAAVEFGRRMSFDEIVDYALADAA